MPFDPTLPKENTPLDAAQMRDQLNGLADMIGSGGGISQHQLDDAIATQTAGPLSNVPAFITDISDPPTKEQVQGIATVLALVVAQLQRQ